ncbi:MAG: hypothetical protein ACI915_004151 [Gammaproteobacteria bacterium]|jgi:hypothetical protein
MSAYAERDYGTLWDTMSEDPRQGTMRVLSHVKQDAKYREVMQAKFNISEHVLPNIGPREFFIALMTGVERASPKMIKLRTHGQDGRVCERKYPGPQGPSILDFAAWRIRVDDVRTRRESMEAYCRTSCRPPRQ